MNHTLIKIISKCKKQGATCKIVYLLFFFHYYSHNVLWIMWLNLFYSNLNKATFRFGRLLPNFLIKMLHIYLGAGDFTLLDHNEGWGDKSPLSHVVDWVIGHRLQQVYSFLYTHTRTQ